MCGYDSKLCMFSFLQIDRSTINSTEGSGSGKDDTLAQATALTLYFASIFTTIPDIIFRKQPKEPPDGAITAVMIMMFISGCISFYTARAYI